MSATVLEFPVKHEPKPIEDRYYCTRCEDDRFHVAANGSLKCVRCSALMRNIRVTTNVS